MRKRFDPAAIIIAATLVLLLGACSSFDDSLPPISPLEPADATTLDTRDAYLRWEAADQAERYQLQLSSDPEFTGTLVLDLRELRAPETLLTSYRVGELYYWRVRYRSRDGGLSAWNGPWRFGTYSGAPAPKSPKEGGFLIERTPRFTWSAESDAIGYDVEVTRGDDPGLPVAPALLSASELEGTAIVFTESLESGDYLWRVRARFPGEVVGEWGVSATFTVVDAWERSFGLYEELTGFRAYASDREGDRFVIGGNLRTPSGSDLVIADVADSGEPSEVLRANLRPRDDLASLVATPAGVLVAATVGDEQWRDRDIWLFATGESNRLLWQTVIGGPGIESAADVALLEDGSIVAVGWFAADTEAPSDGVIVRLSATGEVEWQLRLGGDEADSLSSVEAFGDSIYVAGASRSFGGRGSSIWIVCIDYDGGVIWSRTYDSPLDDSVGGPASLSVDGNGMLIVAGSSSRPNVFGGSMLVLSVAGDGALLSAHEFSAGEHRSFATSVDFTSDGELIVGGNVLAESPTAGGLIRTPKVMRIGRDGEIRWQRGTWGAYPQTVERVEARADGTTVAVGWWFEFNLDAAWVMTIDQEGRYPPDPMSIELALNTVRLSVRRFELEPANAGLEVNRSGGILSEYALESRLIWP